jgi:hypothetical protein
MDTAAYDNVVSMLPLHFIQQVRDSTRRASTRLGA